MPSWLADILFWFRDLPMWLQVTTLTFVAHLLILKTLAKNACEDSLVHGTIWTGMGTFWSFAIALIIYAFFPKTLLKLCIFSGSLFLGLTLSLVLETVIRYRKSPPRKEVQIF